MVRFWIAFVPYPFWGQEQLIVSTALFFCPPSHTSLELWTVSRALSDLLSTPKGVELQIDPEAIWAQVVVLQKCAKKVGVKKAGHRIAGLGNLAWRKSEREPFFSPKKDLQAAFS